MPTRHGTCAAYPAVGAHPSVTPNRSHDQPANGSFFSRVWSWPKQERRNATRRSPSPTIQTPARPASEERICTRLQKGWQTLLHPIITLRRSLRPLSHPRPDGSRFGSRMAERRTISPPARSDERHTENRDKTLQYNQWAPPSHQRWLRRAAGPFPRTEDVADRLH